MDSSSDQRRLQERQSCLERRWTADCGSVWTPKLSTQPPWRTDTMSLWSRTWSTDCEEPGSSWNWTSGTPITLSYSRKATSKKLSSALSMGIWSTESCRLGWRTHQILSKPISTIAYGLTLMTLLCPSLMVYWSSRPMKRSTKSRYKKCRNH